MDWLSRCRMRPFDHQVVGINTLVEKPIFMLADEMGSGKSLQVIVAACILYVMGLIDRVIVVAPSAVRRQWFDPELGELKRHLWDNIHVLVEEFHARNRRWVTPVVTADGRTMHWYVTNYEFIRSRDRAAELAQYADKRTLLVGDESSAIKNPRAAQTVAFTEIRKRCGRVWLLNGTPIANHPGDMFSQGWTMNPKILDCKNEYVFRARYAKMGGWQQKQIVGWHDLDDLQRRFAPYVLRRLKTDCLKDLPEKLPPVPRYVALDPPTWKVYKSMRDDLVAWLSEASVSMAPQAITKVMRLAQITSGYLGGIQELEIDDGAEVLPTLIQPTLLTDPRAARGVQEIGREKLDFLLQWFDERLEEDENFKCVIWSRFWPELDRAMKEAKFKYSFPIGVVAGGYKKTDREFALRLLDPRTAPKGPAFVFGNPQSGGLGLNMTAAHTMIRLSQDYSLFKRLQADDRQHRPGQVHPVSYFDIIATGPQGQKTIDHTVLAALLKKENVATLTTSAWVSRLMEE